eukprot:TRINITY_DN39591_c0_g1_i1.p1 TRINITY_DN39591_c0_g1~~TRINITY_DN39591_c0_g1_i1.p1  ORF type:complete len:480 (+),score=152.06 TRINITY_DN39591_c0_g1_i1:86-1525(+)
MPAPWECPKCGTGGLQGKFCPQCGTKCPELEGGGAVAAKGAGAVATRGSHAHTLAGLQGPGPVSAKGHEIREQMADLADEVFDAKQRVDCGKSETREDYRALHATQARATGASKYDCAVIRDMRPLAPGWHEGPVDPGGAVYEASERNILCMDVRGDECVVGSADHGLKVYDLARKREKRNLYTKKCGHSEWVTCCSYLADGRIISGGMDSKLCLWISSGARCDDLMSHTASLSEVRTNEANIAISSSYDRTLKIWDCDRRSCVATLSGHKQPVMDFIWAHSCLVSGDREGQLRAWDAEQQMCVGALTTRGSDQARGQCSALGWFGDGQQELVMAGDQTGRLRVWDLRTGAVAVHEATLHPGGALTAAKTTFARDPAHGPNYIVTAGADKRMQVVDPRAGFAPVHELEGHKDFIYSVETHDTLVLSGGGNGWLLVHDAPSGKCLYALGANKAAVRCIAAQPTRAIASGDDGTLITYDFA